MPLLFGPAQRPHRLQQPQIGSWPANQPAASAATPDNVPTRASTRNLSGPVNLYSTTFSLRRAYPSWLFEGFAHEVARTSGSAVPQPQLLLLQLILMMLHRRWPRHH